MAYDIRLARIEDIAQIVELCELHAIYEQSSYSDIGKAELLEENLFSEHPSLHCLVVESDGSLIGYATYMRQFSTWDATHYIYMDCLFIKEEARSRGIGEALVNCIKEEGKKLGCNLIQWQTPEFNVRAIKFYKRIGATSLSKERFFLR